MKRDEAIKMVLDIYPNRTVDKVTETDKYYLVSISDGERFKNAFIKPVTIDDGLKAVDKSSGQVFTYNPILHK